MAKQRYTTEEIIHKLREADVLIGQGQFVNRTGNTPPTERGNVAHSSEQIVPDSLAPGRRVS